MMITCIQCNNVEVGISGQPNNNENDDKKTDSSNNSSSNDRCPICTRVIRLVIDLAKDRYQRFTYYYRYHIITTIIISPTTIN